MKLLSKFNRCITLSCVVFLIVGLTGNSQTFDIDYKPATEIGMITAGTIKEASGIAASNKTQDAFWVHNDSGDGPNIYLINKEGNLLTQGVLTNASSRDWEDIASFVMNGTSYLLIGNVGDNPKNKSSYFLYIIEEPTYDPQNTSANSYPIIKTISFQYENGSQDCESIAVDVANEQIILVSKSSSQGKRFVYEIPLSITPGDISTTASLIGQITINGTTAMDISNDGQHAIVLTYDDAYEFTRYHGSTWSDAFATTPRQITMPKRGGGEAICYGTNATDLYLVREGNNSPVWFVEGALEQGAAFFVDMIDKKDIYNNKVWLHIEGMDNPIVMTDTDMDLVYACKVNLPINTTYNYYFSYQNGPNQGANTIIEQNNAGCSNNNLREITLSKQNQILSKVLFEKCTVRPNYVTVQVDMSKIESKTSVWIEVLEENTAFEMTESEQDGFYEYTIPVTKGSTLNYRFFYLSNSNQINETIPNFCNNNGYRSFTTNEAIITMQPLEFGSCYEATPEGAPVTDLENAQIRGSNDNYEWINGANGSGSPDGQTVDKLFDNNWNSRYLVRAVDSWVEILLPKLTTVNAYTITSGSDTPTRDPRSWTFQGLNPDTETWEIIHTVNSNPKWQERKQPKSWYFENQNEYSGYRLHITELNGDPQSLMQMAELEIYGTVGGDAPIPGNTGEYLDDCETKTGWTPNSITLNNTDQKQGDYCLEFTGSENAEFKKKFTTPFNPNGTEMGTVLKFWYYVSDITLLDTNNQVEISSSGVPDIDEYSWNLHNLNNGWNYIQLNTKDAEKRGEPQLNAINWFRLYRIKTGVVTTRIDAIQLIGENELSTDNSTTGNQINLYPNPASEIVYIDFTAMQPKKTSITILNSNGQTAMTINLENQLKKGAQKVEIPIGHLNPGIYIIKINSNDGISCKKIIVQ